MRVLLIICLLIGFGSVNHCNAQKYKSALGLRVDGGKMLGLTYSQRFFKRTTAEINLDFRNQEVKTTILGKYHKRLLGKGLTLFGGVGYHIGNFKDEGAFTGADITLGVEHKILILPLSVSFELNPSAHITGEHPDWYTFQSVFAVKYILVRNKESIFNSRRGRRGGLFNNRNKNNRRDRN
ncbi:MAG: hypothetical protein AB8B53_07280 [Flavobacteriales bacterium]